MDEQVPATPPHGVIVAYLILAHGNPDQLLRLVERLPPESPIFLHFDQRAAPSLYARTHELLGRTGRVEFVERYYCRWGNIGIVQGTMSLIHALVQSKKNFDYAMLISGSDYPIKSNREISSFLQANSGKEFIESFCITEPNRWSGFGGLYKTPEKALGWHVRFRSRVWRLPIVRRPPLGLRVHGGSQWWCLTRGAIRHISSYVAQHPELIRFFSRSFIPDESFVQTVVSNSPFASKVTGDDLRLTIWDRPAPPYPATLKAADYPILDQSPKLFARKFDARQDSTILDLLDRRNQ